MANLDTTLQIRPINTETPKISRSATVDTPSTTTSYLEWSRTNLLFLATDLILIISAIIIIVSCVMSLGIFVLGICRLQEGLEYYTMSYQEKWKNSANSF